MNKPTFKDGFDRITSAYLKDELNPYLTCACFIGNLLNGSESWWYDSLKMGYDFSDVNKLEENFLVIIRDQTMGPAFYPKDYYIACKGNAERDRAMILNHANYEVALFNAMDSTLDMLRKIHEAKGEAIESFEFKKRELVNH